MLFGKYDDLETGTVPALAPLPDTATGEYFSVVVMLGVALACHCCNLIDGSDERYLGSSNGGCGLFSLSLLCCAVVVVGGAGNSDEIMTVYLHCNSAHHT